MGSLSIFQRFCGRFDTCLYKTSGVSRLVNIKVKAVVEVSFCLVACPVVDVGKMSLS